MQKLLNLFTLMSEAIMKIAKRLLEAYPPYVIIIASIIDAIILAATIYFFANR